MQNRKLEVFVVFCDFFATLLVFAMLEDLIFVFPYGLFATPWLREWQRYRPFAVCMPGWNQNDGQSALTYPACQWFPVRL